ncbi:MAG: HAD family hydrolase [Clostridiales bacterium]
MKISFDLDDTLILSEKGSLYETQLKFPFNIIFKERLRKGIIDLCEELKLLGYSISVYTTSDRSIKYIKKLFALNKIKLDKIINQKEHERVVQARRKEIMPSKVPSRFGIDLHVDDDISVKQNGVQYGFNVLIINKNDNDWWKKVFSEAKRIKKLKRYYNGNKA